MKRSTTTSVVSSVNPSTHGNSVTFTATVAPAAGTGTPTGTVQFTDNGANVGVPVALSSGKAAKAITFSLSGSHTIKAAYAGSGGFSASTGTVTQTVN
ncbi:MAG: Ig-like domain-containing protein [Actinobacteria bacterium]|nr:Ig-like domain-containing protein [Actinomycetota bacterium]